MTGLREAAQMALDALEDKCLFMASDEAIYKRADAIKALREALAQLEQESAYGYALRLATAIWEKHYKDESPHWEVNDSLLGVLTQIDNMTTGLAKAQPEREWQGLTDEEMFSLWVKCPAETEDRFAFARAIEAKLKEKNT